MIARSARRRLTAVCFARRFPHPSRSGLRPVNDPPIARVADACGATAPLDLRVDLAAGGVVAEGFGAGRWAKDGWDDACHLTLTGRETNSRIVWIAVDIGPFLGGVLATRTGLWVVDLSG